MKISEARTAPIRHGAAKTRSKSPGGFAEALGAADGTSAPATAAPIAGAAAVLAAQEVGDATEERRKAAKRGTDILDSLDGLRAELLAGSVPAERLAGILASVRSRRAQFTDPRLAEILDEIDLRASVELAKLGRYPE